MDIRGGLIVRSNRSFQEPLPKAAALGPSRLQTWRLLDGDALEVRRSHLKDHRQDRRRHAKDKIKCARHGAPHRPGVDQDLAKERSRSLEFGRVLIFAWHRISASLTRALPPIAALKVKIHEQDRATPRSVAHALVHLRPQRLQHLGDLSRVAPVFLLYACHRHYPGGTSGCIHRSLPQKQLPSPVVRWVGFRIKSFEACSTFTRVTACILAESPT
jgi:hypothetical protein